MNMPRNSGGSPLKFVVIAVSSILLVGATVLAVSCQRKDDAGASPKRSADRVYTVRGEIRMVPTPARPTAQLVIHHEAINDFENPDGSRGMSSMEMPFSPTADVSLEGFSPGDIAEFDLSVWYAPDKKSIDSYRITRMKKLPAGTALNFAEAMPTLGTIPNK
jgi:Cu/Ag efflux protein CusF